MKPKPVRTQAPPKIVAADVRRQTEPDNPKISPSSRHHVVSGCKCSARKSFAPPRPTGIVPIAADVRRRTVLSLLALLLLALLPGCSTCGGNIIPCAAYKPSNVYRSSPIIPVHVRRVAILPISATATDWQANEQRLDLQSVLQSELGKTKSFEQVVVTPEQLQEWTGRSFWLPEDKLPPDIFIKITAQTGCEAILFTRLHPFHGFKPLVSGWEMKLVDVHTSQIIWAVDEVFDAGEPVIAQSAMQWFRNHRQAGLDRQAEPEAVLASPRRFNAYALNSLFATLPARSLQ